LCELVRQAPGKLGRTAVMKLAYLLQTVKGVPLGYDFRLFTYGPFDSDVLDDLDRAGVLKAVDSQIVYFPSGSGYGYEFTPAPGLASLTAKIGYDATFHEEPILWALREFGSASAADLELLSTIV